MCLWASKDVRLWTHRFQYRSHTSNLKIGSPCKLLLAYNIQIISLLLALYKIKPQKMHILSPEHHVIYKTRQTISHDQYLLGRFISGMDFSDISSVSGTTPHPTFKDYFSWGRLAAIWTFCLSRTRLAETSWLESAPSVFPGCAKEALMHLVGFSLHILSFGPALQTSWDTQYCNIMILTWNSLHYVFISFPPKVTHEYWTICIVIQIFARFYIPQW